MGAVKMHDDNDNVCELPTSYSRQLCYHMFCLECGWNVKFDAKGHLQMKEETVESEGKNHGRHITPLEQGIQGSHDPLLI